MNYNYKLQIVYQGSNTIGFLFEKSTQEMKYNIRSLLLHGNFPTFLQRFRRITSRLVDHKNVSKSIFWQVPQRKLGPIIYFNLVVYTYIFLVGIKNVCNQIISRNNLEIVTISFFHRVLHYDFCTHT